MVRPTRRQVDRYSIPLQQEPPLNVFLFSGGSFDPLYDPFLTKSRKGPFSPT